MRYKLYIYWRLKHIIISVCKDAGFFFTFANKDLAPIIMVEALLQHFVSLFIEWIFAETKEDMSL